jgi:hypothetical protein
MSHGNDKSFPMVYALSSGIINNLNKQVLILFYFFDLSLDKGEFSIANGLNASQSIRSSHLLIGTREGIFKKK